jgi:hypothetical protein
VKKRVPVVGRMLRPKATVLPESAIVPQRNLLHPPPNTFTHAVTRTQPYYYAAPQPGAAPDGHFSSGTKVVLISHDGGRTCHVADGRGLYVVTAFDGLRPLK